MERDFPSEFSVEELSEELLESLRETKQSLEQEYQAGQELTMMRELTMFTKYCNHTQEAALANLHLTMRPDM